MGRQGKRAYLPRACGAVITMEPQLEMKILILCLYYPPDIDPGAFRTKALVHQLRERHGNRVHITVVSSTPNRYKTLNVTTDTGADDDQDEDTIHRIPMNTHNSGMLDQALAYRHYFVGARKLARNGQFNIVYATSSRLMTSFLGARIAARHGIPFFLDIRDLFVDTMQSLLRGRLLRMVLPIFDAIERYTFSRTNYVSSVSEAFIPYLKRRGVRSEIGFFPNGIDDMFIKQPSENEEKLAKKKLLVYVGNIGDGQGLDRILPETAKATEHIWDFLIVGYGGAIGKLKERIRDLHVTNITFRDPVPRNRVPEIYAEADALFLHLNNVPAFERVIPSKIFEYAASLKPIVAGLSGYPAKFLKTNVPDALVFDPCAVNQLTRILTDSDLRVCERSEFIQAYRRVLIMGSLADKIVETGAVRK